MTKELLKQEFLKKQQGNYGPNPNQNQNNYSDSSDYGLPTPPLTPPLKPKQENTAIPPIAPEPNQATICPKSLNKNQTKVLPKTELTPQKTP
jgi:hypothetical protein